MEGFYTIGDVHGKFRQYQTLCKKYKYTVQVGDLGFRYDTLNVDTDRHKCFRGNHDSTLIDEYPGNLGRFGHTSLNGVTFFFVGGAFSIDIIVRQAQLLNGQDKTWWWQEELMPNEMFACKKLYDEVKPKIMLTHSVPTDIVRRISKPDIMEYYGWGADYESKTSNFLQILFEEHQPDLWVAGHFHMDWKKEVCGTQFVVLPELGTFKVEE